MDRNHWFRFLVYLMGIAAALTGLFLMFALRPQVDLYTRFKPPAGIGSLDTWLAEKESGIANLKPGLEKQIVWADPLTHAKTPLAIIYIHGFSASKGEIRPVPDQVAKALGANLFYTRLSGHGADGAALGRASAEEWLDDTAEALWIGSQIGDRTIVMATSTGATLVTPLLADKKLSANVAAAIFLSPNFGLKASGSSLLTIPFSRQIVRLVIGANRVVQPLNAAQEKLWTLTYPSEALVPMAALVKAVQSIDLSRIHTPAFFYYSHQDQIVDAEVTDEFYAAWGGPKGKASPGPVEDSFQHVIAGDALSPSGTAPAVEKLTIWLKTQLRL